MPSIAVTAPVLKTLYSGPYVAELEGAPGDEFVQVFQLRDDSLVYTSGAVQQITDLTWSPNSLELAWLTQSPGNVFSYDWAGALPTPAGVPSFPTWPSAPMFSADSSQLEFEVPVGNGTQPAIFSVPTTPPGVKVSVPSSATAGSPFQVTITATANNFVGLSYSGNVDLTAGDGQQVLGQSNLVMTNGAATATIQLQKADTTTITAALSPDYTGTSNAITVVGGASPASFVVSAPGTPVLAGTAFLVSFEALDQYGNVAAGFSGPVTLLCGNGSFSQAVSPSTVLFTGGQATANVTLDTAGTFQLTAAYQFVRSTSGNITVNPDATTTTLAASANPSVFGQTVTYTATVSAVPPGSVTPTGFVNFVIDGKAPMQVPLSPAGQASLAVPSLGVGPHTINASYLGSADDLASQATASQTVKLALSPAALPAATAGKPYSQSFSALGGSGNYSYALTSGSTLPAGLVLSGAGVLSGSTTVAATYQVSVTATDKSLVGVTGTSDLHARGEPRPVHGRSRRPQHGNGRHQLPGHHHDQGCLW